jgi:hypothetical protein|tara:strand:- start:67 stop:357 length:291 start_codon:yes stop_codon:yes gene_type:complete
MIYWRSAKTGYDTTGVSRMIFFEPYHAYIIIKQGVPYRCNSKGKKIRYDKEFLPEGYWVKTLNDKVNTFGFIKYTNPEIVKYERYEYSVRKEIEKE